MPVTLHQRNRSPIPDWDFPAYPSPSHRRHWVRTHRRFVPCCAHGQHIHPHCLHTHRSYYEYVNADGDELVTVRRRAPTTNNHCNCHGRLWNWLCPCFGPCGCVRRNEGRGRTINRQQWRREDTCPCHICVEHERDAVEAAGRTWERGRRSNRGWREAGRVRVRLRGGGSVSDRSPPRPFEGGEARTSPFAPPSPSPPVLPPPPPLLYCSPYHRRREGGGRRDRGRCTCPDCTGEQPDLIDQLCAGVDTLAVGRGEWDEGSGGILPPPNSRLSSRLRSLARRSRSRGSSASRAERVRERSRRPYWRGRDGDAEGSAPGVLDTESDDARGYVPGFGRRDCERRGRMRRRSGRRGSGLGVGRVDEVLNESSDSEGWGRGLDRRRAW